MNYTVFNQHSHNHLLQPLFLGENVNISRFDQQRYPILEQLTEKAMSFYWRPEEIDLSRDRIDFASLADHEKHIFTSNLQYQTLLDSIQSRSPNVVLLPIVSLPELETWIETWAFYEAIHSRSYTHIIRNISNEPSVFFDDITNIQPILDRAKDIARYYDELYDVIRLYQLFDEKPVLSEDGEKKQATLEDLKRKLYRCILAINALEGIRFYVSFACSFSFAERKLMEGNAKIIKLIARDEALHLNGTQTILNLWHAGKDDAQMFTIAKEMQDEAIEIFESVADQEKAWAKYLFSNGSVIGLNEQILVQYVEYITNLRMTAIGLPPLFDNAKNNPIPWINTWLSSDNVQVAPQETEITTYLVGQINAELANDTFEGFEL